MVHKEILPYTQEEVVPDDIDIVDVLLADMEAVF